jgi:hypothetical protein
MRGRAVALAIALSGASAVYAQDLPPIDVKGVTLGVNEQEVKSKFAFPSCKDEKNRVFGDRSCTVFKTTYAEAPAIITFVFMNDKLGRILIIITPSDYSQIVRAMTTRFGKPAAIENADVTTRTGANFNNEITKWALPTGEIEAKKYSGSISSGQISFQSSEAKLESIHRLKELQKQREKDL